MPFVKIDREQEQREFEELIKDPAVKSALEKFEREYAFRQKLAQVKKLLSLSKKFKKRIGLLQ